MQATSADLGQLAGGQEALIEALDAGVVACGGQRGHVEHAADLEASPCTRLRPFMLPESLAIGATPTRAAAISRRWSLSLRQQSFIRTPLLAGPHGP